MKREALFGPYQEEVVEHLKVERVEAKLSTSHALFFAAYNFFLLDAAKEK